MPLSNNELQILAQLESGFSDDDAEHLADIERRSRRRWVIATVMVPIGLLSGLVLVVIGVGLNGRGGNILAVVAYLLIVASGDAAMIGVRRVRTARRQYSSV